MIKFYKSLPLFCLSFLIIFCFPIFSFSKPQGKLNIQGSFQPPNLPEGPSAPSCATAHKTAFEKACNEKTYSAKAKHIISAFQIAQQAGNIKKACETAKQMNHAAQSFNSKTARACHNALSKCIKQCQEELNQNSGVLPSSPTQGNHSNQRS